MGIRTAPNQSAALAFGSLFTGVADVIYTKAIEVGPAPASL